MVQVVMMVQMVVMMVTTVMTTMVMVMVKVERTMMAVLTTQASGKLSRQAVCRMLTFLRLVSSSQPPPEVCVTHGPVL